MSAINNIQVTENSDRLDRYLSQELSDLSRSRIQQLIEQGHVQVNEKICTSKKINLKTGDRITLEIPAVQPLELIAEDIPLDILYEDDELIILNKPAGLVVHPAPGHPDGTLVNAILAHCPNLPGIGGVQRPGIVHRLDKDTSGLMLVAKNDFTHQSLSEKLRLREIKRTYISFVYGALLVTL